jgi:hypothetical protein
MGKATARFAWICVVRLHCSRAYEEVMRSIERIVVDECLGRAPPILEQLRRRLENREVELVFLAVEHPGIPDVDILEKLLDARTAC